MQLTNSHKGLFQASLVGIFFPGYKDCQEIRKRVLGAEHLGTLTSMANLAFTLKEQGRGAEALSLMKDCVRLRSKVLGSDHPDIMSSSATLICWQTEDLNIDVPVVNGAV